MSVFYTMILLLMTNDRKDRDKQIGYKWLPITRVTVPKDLVLTQKFFLMNLKFRVSYHPHATGL